MDSSPWKFSEKQSPISPFSLPPPAIPLSDDGISPLALPSPAFPLSNDGISPLALPPPAITVPDEANATICKQSFGQVAWGDAPKPWGPKKQVLKSMVTGDEFQLGYPPDSLLCKRRNWNRKTDRGRLCDHDGWQGSQDNQERFNHQMKKNRQWRQKRGFALFRAEDFKPVDWKGFTSSRPDVPVSPRTVPTDMIDDQQKIGTDPIDRDAFSSVTWDGPAKPASPHPSLADPFGDSTPSTPNLIKPDADFEPQTPSTTCSSLDLLLPKSDSITGAKKSFAEVTGIDVNGENKDCSSSSGEFLAPPEITLTAPSTRSAVMSVSSLARFIEREAPGFNQLTLTDSLNDEDDDPDSEDFDLDDSVIEEATIAIPISMPAPVPPRGASLMNLRILEAGAASRARRPISITSDASSETAHHIGLIPTTYEIGTATAVRMYRPPPVRLIVVRGRVVALNQAEAEAAGAPWETASVLEPQEAGCHSPVRLWSRIKRKLQRT